MSVPASSVIAVPLKFPAPYMLPAALSARDVVEAPPTPALFVISPVDVVNAIVSAVSALVFKLIPLLFVRSTVFVTLAVSADSVNAADDVLLMYACDAANVRLSANVLIFVVSDAAF